ncbi:response regulator transcription factor [Paenibacillus bouchesdurhonensis]|uniref:response regulator transcription factor n=1 Tax=Paenibacillus bouchesdurhonensis TaxID=1870990 RepID=UPI001F2E8BEA|nr:response regulator transcription factor [Paenibacillus bouchesdurhonensis]
MIQQYLELYAFRVTAVSSGEQALKAVLHHHYDIIILDVMMPDLDGVALCEMIREKVICPIVFLSAKTLEEDKIKALSSGGDDYIEKPFSLAELKARIECHIRRDERIRDKGTSKVSSGRLVVDLDAKILTCNGMPIHLTKKEYQIVEFMILHKGRVFTKEDIFERIWGHESQSYYDTVTESIKNIRKKIREHDSDYAYIKTLYGLGYRWEVQHET